MSSDEGEGRASCSSSRFGLSQESGALPAVSKEICASRFSVFRAERGAAPDSLEEFDLLACEFIEATWHECDPKLWCSDLLASLHFYLLTCRRRLHGAWALLKAWEKAELP